LRYDEERKRVVYEPLQLTQAFRSVSFTVSPRVALTFSYLSNFESLSPWEQVGDGTNPTLPEEFKIAPPPPPKEEKK
jgi:NADH dehydrogenase (ubiquinone) Fe-S protein 3